MTRLDEAAGLLSEVLAAFKIMGLKTPPESLMGRIGKFLADQADVPIYGYTCNLCKKKFTGPEQGAECPHCPRAK